MVAPRPDRHGAAARHDLVVPAWFVGQPFLTAQWWTIPGIDFKASTPLIFDVGVYLVVLGSVLTMVMT
jgi:multicomponent Na+:H+ antiporter subunit B